MSRVIEGPSLSPVELILEAHPDVRVGLYNLSDRDEKLFVASHYFISGNLSDGRFGVVGIQASSGERTEAGYESVLKITAKAFVNKSDVRFTSHGPVLSSDIVRDPGLNTLKVSTKNRELVVETESTDGEGAIDSEEIRFLALKGMALVDTLERFATPDEKLIAPGIITAQNEPYSYNGPVGSNGFMIESAERNMDFHLFALALSVPGIINAPIRTKTGEGRPFLIRHILKNIVLPNTGADHV